MTDLMADNTILIRFLLYIFIIFMIFLLLREVMLWYWKVNEISGVLKEIRDGINKLIDKEHKGD
ncbi:hypothetical protein BMS3Bbin08_00072 [bacterium BMS3Bbin08]|nr:hypothetical protein BMS3Bbin08_00072 [bacterium BMS3Bbin08]